MDTTDNTPPKSIETVSETKPKKTRKFTWTEKRKAQFEKMMSTNREKSKSKKSKKEDSKADEKEIEEKEITQKEVEELENKKELEKEEKQSKNIVKRIMDSHYLSRKDRHMIGTTSEQSSDSDNSSDDSDSTSGSESSVEKKKKLLKKPKSVKKDWKLERRIEKLRLKNKQLQDLVLKTPKKKHKKYPVEPQSSDESDPEPINYSRTSTSVPPSLYFC